MILTLLGGFGLGGLGLGGLTANNNNQQTPQQQAYANSQAKALSELLQRIQANGGSGLGALAQLQNLALNSLGQQGYGYGAGGMNPIATFAQGLGGGYNGYGGGYGPGNFGGYGFGGNGNGFNPAFFGPGYGGLGQGLLGPGGGFGGSNQGRGPTAFDDD